MTGYSANTYSWNLFRYLCPKIADRYPKPIGRFWPMRCLTYLKKVLFAPSTIYYHAVCHSKTPHPLRQNLGWPCCVSSSLWLATQERSYPMQYRDVNEDGLALIYIDRYVRHFPARWHPPLCSHHRHLVHEVTSPQAFEGLYVSRGSSSVFVLTSLSFADAMLAVVSAGQTVLLRQLITISRTTYLDQLISILIDCF